jgi:LysM repeat protein
VNRRLILIAGGAFLLSVLLIFALVNIAKKIKPLGASRGSRVSSANLLSQAKEQIAKNDLLQAKALYQRLISEFSSSNEIMSWQKDLEGINISLLFSSQVIPKSALYEVKPGDNLIKIAKLFGTTVDLIKKSNNIANNIILPGKKLRVWTVPFNIFVDKSQNTLILKSQDEIIKTYIASTGLNNSTPAGVYKAGAVVSSGSPENVLGTRWMGFDLPGYGIHGTTDPQSLGKQATQGCVRLSNSEVEELYTIVPVGTEVTIVD